MALGGWTRLLANMTKRLNTQHSLDVYFLRAPFLRKAVELRLKRAMFKNPNRLTLGSAVLGLGVLILADLIDLQAELESESEL